MRHPSARDLNEAIERFLDGDRDLERRRQLADEHAAVAAAAASQAMLGHEARAERARAMREVSAALALHPSHPSAMSTLIKLLVEVPVTMPPEAEAEFEATRRATIHAAHRVVPLMYAAWLPITAASAVLGVRSLAAYLTACGLQAACALTSWQISRRPPPGRGTRFLYVLTAAALAATGGFLGPLVVVPGLAGMIIGAFIAFGDPRHRRLLILLGVLTVAGPFALEALGVLAPTYELSGDVMMIHSKMTWLPPQRTLSFWLVSSLAMVLAPSVLMKWARDEFSAAEMRIFLHAWHLRQLMPAAADAAGATSGERRPAAVSPL
jgi:serine/threonine-protein kinase